MKIKSIIFLAIGSLFLTLTSCKDFLNQPVYDDFTDEEYWNNEDQCRTFMYSFYPSVFVGYGSGYSHGQFLMGEGSNDDYVSSKEQADFSNSIPETNGSWSFSSIRRANYALTRIPTIAADEATIAHWMGVARFFRAYYYANLVFTFGDVPWFDRVPQVSSSKTDLDYLYKDRDSRTYVDSMIMADLQYAMDNVKPSDGALQVNKYVVAAMTSRLMLREGTYLRYHNIDLNVAEQCLTMAKSAADMVIKSGKYSLAADYKSLFISADLSSNPEVIMYRHYEDGQLSHSTLTYSFTEGQGGLSKSFAMAFLTSDGFPMSQKHDMFWVPNTLDKFFGDRDPRMAMVMRNKFYFKGSNEAPFGYSLSGLAWNKFMDDARATTPEATWSGSKNVTDAPCLRYAEILLNYTEAAYELSELGAGTFSNEDLKPLNEVRKRAGIPDLQVSGTTALVGGVEVKDEDRLAIENETGETPVTPILWEIRRERRVELCLEGFRAGDLKRWKRMDYMWNGCNPDIRYGAYVVLANYTEDEIAQGEIVLDDEMMTEGWALRNTLRERNRPTEKNYISPVPTGQITLYESKGYTLTQTKEWQ